MLTVLAMASILVAQEVDLTGYDPACGVAITVDDRLVRAAWSSGDQHFTAIFDPDRKRPLISLLECEGRAIARDVEPRFGVTVGSRKTRSGEPYVFFDKPESRRHVVHPATLESAGVRVTSAGHRAALTFAGLTAGPFGGELVVTIHDGSPFLHFEAAMKPEKLVAYVYDFVLEGDFPVVTWKDLRNRFVEVSTENVSWQAVAVRNRIIMARTAGGTLAVFPPPHAFFYPRDYTNNFKFAQYGEGSFGLRQDLTGGKGHQGKYIPWFDGPANKTQRMGAFVLLHGGRPAEAFERVMRYTHGDTFKVMKDRLTLTSHWHARLTVGEMEGKPRAPEFARLFKSMGINIVHLAEFHGDGNPRDPGPKRLSQLKAMFDTCRKHSSDRFLLLPGEEANAHLNHPPPSKQKAGHWLYLFPKPVYLTLVRKKGQPFMEEIPPYGRVYHTGSEADMVEVLRREKALAWTAHPRIKSSSAAPDGYRERDWYKDDSLWLGGGWKYMPGDLSDGRLGVRVLDLLDDMNRWGQHKKVIGEVDCFTVDSTHEIYGHMNVNYLRLKKMPTFDD